MKIEKVVCAADLMQDEDLSNLYGGAEAVGSNTNNAKNCKCSGPGNNTNNQQNCICGDGEKATTQTGATGHTSTVSML